MARKRKRRAALGAVEILTLPRRKRPYRMQRVKPDVRIAYGAPRNKNKRADGGGFVPMIWVDGRPSGNDWLPYALDRDDACAMARDMAKEEIDHYGGDWNILFVDRCARGPRKKRR